MNKFDALLRQPDKKEENGMSAGSFDASGDGSRKRIAHKGATSSDLIRSLNYKRESMGRLLNSSTSSKNSGTSRRDVFPLFNKRQKMSSDSENDKAPKKKIPSVKTFCGKSFMSAVASGVSQKNEITSSATIHSDSEESEPGWMSKSKVINGTISKAGKPLPPPPGTDFMVHRRAILSSDEEENGVEFSKFDIKIEKTRQKKDKARRPTPAQRAKKRHAENFVIMKKARKHDVSTESEFDEENSNDDDMEEDEELEDEEEIADTSSSSELSSEEDDLNPKKTLKELTAKAKKLHAKRKRHGGQSAAALSDGSDAGEEDGEAPRGSVARDDYDSEDSDAAERQDKRSLRQRRILEDRCLEFVNTATEEELLKTEKFNERLVKLLLEKRPFRSFSELTEEGASIGRGAAMLESYLEFLENRSILDQVLDDCKKQSEEIKAELKRLENASALTTQPALLNPKCVLHPYQQVGLQWLIMMHKLGLNAILADEMGLGKTIQIIAFLAWAKSQPKMSTPHLIVVPSSTLENWMNEIAKWCPSLRLLTYYGSIQERSQLRHRASTRNVDIILTTYNMVISRPEDRSFFKKFSINYVIYDEGHMLRSCNSMRYKNLMRVQGKRKILLTGTPLQNNLVELISLLFFTMTKMFTKYCDDITMLLQMFAHKGGALHSGKSRAAATNGADKKKGAGKGKKGRGKAAEEEDEDEGLETNGADENGNGADDPSGRPLYERHKIAQAKSILHPFVLRRLKINVLDRLPKKHEHVEVCDITDAQDTLYVEVLKEFRDAKVSGNANALGALMQMRQVANHPLLYRRNFDDFIVREMANVLIAAEPKYKGKNAEYVAEDLSYMTDIAINSLCRKFASLEPYELSSELALNSGKCKQLDTLLPKIFNKGEKVLIFSQFTSLLDILELYMENRDHKFCRLDGSTPVMERQDLINKFSSDPSIKVFLLSTKAGGLGINLTAANNIIIHDIDLNPYNDKQAEDRCHRMGQTREVHVTRLISRNTIEESILELAKKKLELEKDITSGHNQKEELDSKTVEELITRAIDRRT